MALTRYIFYWGEPIIIGDRVESGNVLPGHSMRARMKPAQAHDSSRMPGDNIPIVAPGFVTTFVAAAGDVAAHWLHTLSADVSAELPAGEYLADSALLLNGDVISVSDPVRIVLHNSASAY